MKKLLLFVLFFLPALIVIAQTKTIIGRVIDSKDGSPIAGASITAKGSTNGTVSANDGTFSLKVSENVTRLIVSYLDYDTKEVAISRDLINVSLTASELKSLNEVVVVGYGTRIKKDVISSISKVSSKEFNNLPLPSFEQALQGRAPGVFINSGSGKLGQPMNIRVRGIASISASQQPFIVIDGIPVVSRSLGIATEGDNPLAVINPDDIESIEILKDAAASAIYGSRASNGVLLVTTKSGKAGKTRINANFYDGFSDPTKKGKFLNATQYRELFTEATKNSIFNGVFWNTDDPADAFLQLTGYNDWADNPDVNSNWVDKAFQKGSVKQYSLSVSGGDAKTKFFASGSYNNQEGIIIGNRLDRANGKINIDHVINSRLKMGINIGLMKSRNFREPEDLAFSNPQQINALPPIQPIIAPQTGKLNTNTIYYNNLIDQGASSDIGSTFKMIGSVYGELMLTPTIIFRSQAGIDWDNLQEERYLGRETQNGAPTGLGFNNQVTSGIFTATNTINWKKQFGETHNIDLLLGTEYQKGKVTSVSAEGLGFPSDKFTKIASAAVIDFGSSTETQYSFVSYFSKANYKLDNRYLLGMSFRVDGSSRFGKDNRYGVFPAASAGWIISEEHFLKGSKSISFLKIRGSYGRTGNAEIGNFSSLSLFGSLPYADIAGLVATQIGLPDLNWERTDQLDIGLDFGFLNNRITGEVDYFNKKTRDLLLGFPLPAVNGFTSIVKNIGNMENKGWEFSLSADIFKGKFSWNASANLSTYRNKVTKIVSPILPTGRNIGRLAAGQPFGQFYGKYYAGVDPANGDALYYLADKSTTNNYDLAVDTIIGDPNPDFYGGFNNHFSYKGFDLDIQCQFVKGNDVYNIAGVFQSVNGDYYDNQTIDQMNYWKKPGDITNIPQPRLISSNGTDKSSRWVQDGSYLRVKSINFGYNLPRKWISRIKLENARVYMAANNLFTFTKYKGYDPEVNSGSVSSLNLGHDFYTPPLARTITFGVSISL